MLCGVDLRSKLFRFPVEQIKPFLVPKKKQVSFHLASAWDFVQLGAWQIAHSYDSCQQNEMIWAGKSWQEVKMEASNQQDSE